MCVGSWASRRSCPACAGSTSRSTTAARGPVVERAVRLVEHNGERFAKTIRAGPAAAGPARPRARRRRRDDPPGAGHPVVAGRRVDAGGPRPDQPRAAAGGRRRAPSSACRSGRRGSSCCSSRRSSTRSSGWPRSAGDEPERRSPLLRRTSGAIRDRGHRRPRRRGGRDGAARLGGRPFDDLAAFAAAIARDARRGWPSSGATTRR